jgi:predicted outer membrane repeat protein
MKHWILIACCLLPIFAFADTTWVAPGEVSGVWTPEHSPYMVRFQIEIPHDWSLTIMPGVEVNFTGNIGLMVDGELVAIGTATDSIYFTRHPGDSLHRWNGIHFSLTSRGQLNYCVFEWMNPSQNAGIQIACIATEFEHCTFRRNLSHTIVLLNDQAVGMVHCNFEHNGTLGQGSPGGALYLSQNSSAWLWDCYFVYNGALDGGVIQANTGSFLSLDRCVFKNNHAGIWGGAIYGNSATIEAARCTFLGNRSQNGSHIMAVGTAAATRLNSCIFAFSRHTGGAFFCNGHTPAIRNCAIFGNQPIFFPNGGGGQPGFSIVDHENGNGTPCDIYANIFLDPQFADTSEMIPYLLAVSPCIDAADSLLGLDPDGTPADIGAIPYSGELHASWTIHFAGGFDGIGCPCAYPFQLVEGSLVRLRTPDDPELSRFAVSAGAGLPPWNGDWTPRPDRVLRMDSFYVEILAGACCWQSGTLQFADSDTTVIDHSSWSCFDAGAPGGCDLGPAPNSLEPPRPSSSLSLKLDSYPNPFNARTEFRFELAAAARVNLTIYDLQGRRVIELADGPFESGAHRLSFDGTNLATGIYFAQLTTGAEIAVHKLLLLK